MTVELRLLEVDEAQTALRTDVLAFKAGGWCFVMQYRASATDPWTHVPVVWMGQDDKDGVIR